MISRLSPVQMVPDAKLRSGLPTSLMGRHRTVGRGAWDTRHTGRGRRTARLSADGTVSGPPRVAI